MCGLLGAGRDALVVSGRMYVDKGAVDPLSLGWMQVGPRSTSMWHQTCAATWCRPQTVCGVMGEDMHSTRISKNQGRGEYGFLHRLHAACQDPCAVTWSILLLPPGRMVVQLAVACCLVGADRDEATR
jgi:hypothetical protein